ncbi:MAG TPA: serine/threonine-protein kinase [Steroidobacteraceae bacterium]|nr:serine/threonine-protein kinase [Steroidobacteraceae bacterium]
MRLRLLLIADRPEYRLLARKHVEIEWPDADLHEHRLGEDEPLDAKFTAAGFDAAIILGSPAGPGGFASAPASGMATEHLAAGLASRPEFAPLVLIVLGEPPPVRPADTPRIQRLYGRKIDRDGLVRAISSASREHRQALAARRSQPEFEQVYKFGATTIRGHRCIRQVGSGGMCKIYLAESERAPSLVVLKVFSQVPDVSERIVGFDRFLQEYEIVAGLNHPNIVRIYDLGVADDHAYIAMEHFPAGDLRLRMKAPVSPDAALSYLKQMASALEAIHAVGVLHRDLKPANVMLRADGTLCLIDFGLAKANELDAELTGSREIFGTPYYMSPEQGHAELIDARSDLYSLGIVYYEMLTGRKPYTGASAMEVIYKHRRAELPAIDSKYSFYEPILRRLLAKSPQDRFQSARELLRAVDELRLPA